MQMTMEEQNIAQDIKGQILDRVMTGIKENFITREEARKIIAKEDLLPIRENFEKDGDTGRWIGDVEVNHKGEMVAKEDFKKVEKNKDDWMGDWINREVSNPTERLWEIKQCQAVIEAFSVQIEACDNKRNNFERKLRFLENC